MSTQSDAKAAQCYVPKAHSCSDCASLQSAKILPAWMRAENAEFPDRWNDTNAVEKNMRCGIGGFAVKKMGVCNRHTAK